MILAATTPSAYWYLTRGTGLVALLLLTSGVLLGVLTSTKWTAPRWPRFVVSALHRNVTLLALAFVVVHVVTTILDGYAPIGLRDAVLPFASRYRPVWVGLGAVSFDLLLALIATSLLRARLGLRARDRRLASRDHPRMRPLERARRRCRCLGKAEPVKLGETLRV